MGEISNKLGLITAVIISILYARYSDYITLFSKDKHERSEPILGIDIGSACMSAAIFIDGDVMMIPDIHGRYRIPTVLSFKDGGIVLIGNEAAVISTSNAERTVCDFFKIIGKPWNSSLRSSDNICAKYFHGNNKPIVKIFQDSEFVKLTAIEIYGIFMLYLKENAEKIVSETIKKAVVTMPAVSRDMQRRAVWNAGILAGLDQIRILNSPTASTVAYLHHVSKQNDQTMSDEETLLLVIDVGASHTDVSIISVSYNEGKELIETIATAGTEKVSGNAFSSTLYTFIKNKISTETGLNKTADTRSKMMKEVERAKRELSTKESVTIEFKVNAKGRSFSASVTRQEFEKMNEKLFVRLRSLLREVFKHGREMTSDPDIKTSVRTVLLCGGSSRVPAIKDHIQDYMGTKVSFEFADLTLPSKGAALHAMGLSENKEHSPSLVVDIASYGIRYKTMKAGKVEFPTAIKRFSRLPVNFKANFTIAQDKQSSMEISVFEGGSEVPTEENRWGTCAIFGIEPSLAGFPMMEYTFEISRSGLFNCKAISKSVKIGDQRAFPLMPNLSGNEKDKQKHKVTNIVSKINVVEQTMNHKNQINNFLWYLERVTRSDNCLGKTERTFLQAKVSSVKEWLHNNETKMVGDFHEKIEALEEEISKYKHCL